MAMMARRWLTWTKGAVEPGAFLQELQIAGTVGIDIGQADQEEAVGDREAGQRGAVRRSWRRPVRLGTSVSSLPALPATLHGVVFDILVWGC
jgi:hypothetical protein